MRTVYLGTSEFAAIVLEGLAGTRHRPELVVTRPDRPRGRGRRMRSPPVADKARELGLELVAPDSVNDETGRATIAAPAPEVVIICAFGALLAEPLLSEHVILNVHPSLLPRWRGAAPIERAMIAGDQLTGVSIMSVTAALDSGPVALTADEPIASTDTYGTLAPRLAATGATLLIDALELGLEQLSFAEQDEAGVVYADKITAADRILDPTQDAGSLQRRVRALTPHIGSAVIGADGERLGVLAASARTAAPGDPPPGVLSLDGPELLLGCAERSTLRLEVVQPAGRRPMDADAFVRGRRG